MPYYIYSGHRYNIRCTEESYLNQTYTWFDCFLLWIPDAVLDAQIVPIGIFLSLLIISISIFAKIKGDYRWFLLNQSLFEVLYLSLYSTCLYQVDSKKGFESSMLHCWRYWGISYRYPIIFRLANIIFWHERSVVILTLLLLTSTRYLSICCRWVSYDKYINRRSIAFVIVVSDLLFRVYSFLCGYFFYQYVSVGVYNNLDSGK